MTNTTNSADVRQDSISVVSDSAQLLLGQDEEQSHAATADIHQSGKDLNPNDPRDADAQMTTQPPGLGPGSENLRDISTSRGASDEREGRLSSLNSTSASNKSVLRDVRFGQVELLAPWFPDVDPSHKRARGWRTWHSKREVVLWTGFITSTIVLAVNVACLIVFSAKYGSTSYRGVVSLYEGDCTRVRITGIVSHLCINILSTLLLGASNLCTQLLVAPTRDEVNKAHRKKIWLDVGVPSWRNLRYIGSSRRRLWFCLGLSSIPLHFIYNSAISTSIAQYGYATIVASESFLHGAQIGNWTEISTVGVDPRFNNWPSTAIWNSTQAFLRIQANAPNSSVYEKLSNRGCIEKYSNVFAARTSLVVVTEDFPGDQNSSVHYEFQGNNAPMNPTCIDLSRNSQSQYDNWKRFNRTVLYCLTLLHKQPTLSTVGDAIASFLDDPDDASAHMGPVTKSMFRSHQSRVWTERSEIMWLPPKTQRWYSGPSARRWIFTMTVCTLAIAVALASAIPGSHGTQKPSREKTFSWQMKQSIGRPAPDSFTAYFMPKYGTQGFIANVIWANMWQVIISFLYLAYNALLTCMLVSDEWSGYATDRKTLRVTHPRGIQRSSYFVSMPYKYGIPLMAANTTLHWLVSQSIFVVSTIAYLPNLVEDISNSYTAVTGYSTSAAVISISFGTAMVLIILFISCKKVSSGIPLASTCSIVISATCHRPTEDIDASLLPVQWGVITPGGQTPARCSFTTLRTVRPPHFAEEIGGERETCEMEWEEVTASKAKRGWRKVWKLRPWSQRKDE
ncbi:uncharacterized protein BDZ99DRAFT_502510 [Mytilinidion resinicola]|uniref:DUF6536 domain-containing protein n=1 Tax=Mytilinidion resinicola TaxID=574789 RepID=A0A6A6Y946_9PEZI|nr:uncharacterized protein BDZ99DRAFT_502510 [Mytilinidion resinicola]KAF2804655.1 hypothetical protein BDZ99DRAFT_502510 [Mytilinidion resinicola]